MYRVSPVINTAQPGKMKTWRLGMVKIPPLVICGRMLVKVTRLTTAMPTCRSAVISNTSQRCTK